jgi:hypothetical protein
LRLGSGLDGVLAAQCDTLRAMGYIKHHAIVVTGSRWKHALPEDREGTEIDDAHTAAREAGCLVSEIVGPGVNDTFSFLVAADGSKEGWGESDEGDRARDRFVAWLDRANGPAGGWFEWVEVWYGNDDAGAGVVRHQDSAWVRT